MHNVASVTYLARKSVAEVLESLSEQNCEDLGKGFGFEPRVPARHKKRDIQGLASPSGVGFEPTLRFPVTSRSRSVVEPSLRPVSPQNGHPAEDARRFSGQQHGKYRTRHLENL